MAKGDERRHDQKAEVQIGLDLDAEVVKTVMRGEGPGARISGTDAAGVEHLGALPPPRRWRWQRAAEDRDVERIPFGIDDQRIDPLLLVVRLFPRTGKGLDDDSRPRRRQIGPFPSLGEPGGRCRHPILLDTAPPFSGKRSRIATSQACVIEIPRVFAECNPQVDGCGKRRVKTPQRAATFTSRGKGSSYHPTCPFVSSPRPPPLYSPFLARSRRRCTRGTPIKESSSTSPSRRSLAPISARERLPASP